MHAITCASSPAPPRSTLKHGSMGSVHVWEGSAARAARSERGRGLPNREGATSGGNTCVSLTPANIAMMQLIVITDQWFPAGRVPVLAGSWLHPCLAAAGAGAQPRATRPSGAALHCGCRRRPQVFKIPGVFGWLSNNRRLTAADPGKSEVPALHPFTACSLPSPTPPGAAWRRLAG